MSESRTVEAARNRWKNILPALGIPREFLTGRHGPCPLCGEGKDRWRFDNADGKGTWICTHCGAGDGVKLVQLRHGCDIGEAFKMVDAMVGTTDPAPPKPERSAADKLRYMQSIARAAEPITPQSAAGKWLMARLGQQIETSALKAAEDLAYYVEKGIRPRHYPGMVAAVWSPAGKRTSLHLTYLAKDGSAAPVAPFRKLMGPIEPGSAIRLQDAAATLGVAEGIESALSASILYEMPVWSLINARNLERFDPPSGVTELWIFGDNDGRSKATGEENLGSYTGQAAAYALARRLRAKGDLKVHVEVPSVSGEDWNDVLRAMVNTKQERNVA